MGKWLLSRIGAHDNLMDLYNVGLEKYKKEMLSKLYAIGKD